MWIHCQCRLRARNGCRPIIIGWAGSYGKVFMWKSHRRRFRLRSGPWKAPLPQFIEYLYLKRFGRERPQAVTPAEEWDQPAAAKKPARNAVATNGRGEQ